MSRKSALPSVAPAVPLSVAPAAPRSAARSGARALARWRGALSLSALCCALAACELSEPPGEEAGPAAPAESVVGQAAMLSSPRSLGDVACDEAAVLAAIQQDALVAVTPRPAWRYTSMWAYAPGNPSCVKGTSAALGTDYVRCGFDYATPAGSAIRRYGESAIYYCASQQFHRLQGVFTPYQVRGETYIFHVRTGGWVDDGGGRPYARCYQGMKLDGRAINDGLTQCFRGGTRLHRVGDALVASSLSGYGEQDYRFAIFEEETTRACIASTCQNADISVPLPY